jgi:hypothetical protein
MPQRAAKFAALWLFSNVVCTPDATIAFALSRAGKSQG